MVERQSDKGFLRTLGEYSSKLRIEHGLWHKVIIIFEDKDNLPFLKWNLYKDNSHEEKIVNKITDLLKKRLA